MTPEQVIEILEQIGRLLTPAAEKVFAMALASIHAVAVVDTWVAIVCGIVFVVSIIGAITASSGDYNVQDFAPRLYVLAVAALIICIVFARQAYLYRAAPEYYALIQLLGTLGAK